MIYNIVGSSDDLLQATFVDKSCWIVAVPTVDSSQPKNSFSMMTGVQLYKRPIWWVTLCVPVLYIFLFLFCYLLFFFPLAWPDLDWCFKNGGYNTVSPHAAICKLFMKNKHGKKTNNKIVSKVEFVTSLFSLLLTCAGAHFCTFGVYFFFLIFPHKSLVLLSA